MKLLLDNNISARLVAPLQEFFPGSAHVRDFALQGASDKAVWEHARGNGFAIVSKDADFHQRSLVLGAPPKFIWLRQGNCSTDEILAALIENRDKLLRFDSDPEAAFLALG